MFHENIRHLNSLQLRSNTIIKTSPHRPVSPTKDWTEEERQQLYAEIGLDTEGLPVFRVWLVVSGAGKEHRPQVKVTTGQLPCFRMRFNGFWSLVYPNEGGSVPRTRLKWSESVARRGS